MYRAHISFDDRQIARTAAALLEESVIAPPSALSLFEVPGAGWVIDAYYESDPGRDPIIETLEAAAPGSSARLAFELVPEENWVAISQAGLPPVPAGRLLIYGSHDRAIGRQRRNGIEIDAGEAFGTAHHASTLGCLLAIDRLTEVRAYRNVLDLGSGSGVLAIAVGRLLPNAVIAASDSDTEAIRVSTENMRKNAMAARIRPVQALGLDHPALRRAAPYDLIIANILAGPLIRLAKTLAQAAAPGGALVLSGILAHQAPAVLAAYAAAGFVRTRVDHLTGWVVLTLERRSLRH
jgi:ribosomal protein L11 methyltransferase